jgi:FAD/FMN-containing dehydrogenase
MNKFTRRSALIGLGGLAGWGISQTMTSRLPVYDGTRQIHIPKGETILNDASSLSGMPVHKHIVIGENRGEALENAVRTELLQAQKEGRAFNIGAARHSMGGQAIPHNGFALTFDNAGIELDQDKRIYRAHAGARWHQVIAALDPQGYSPAVMQSNHDFGVAATFSVNAHGWPVPYGPMGSTVRAIKIMLADGQLVTASPSENTGIFNAAMGGYGLIGAILEMDVDMVPNTRLLPSYDKMPTADFAKTFQAAIDDPSVTMAYGRLNVERDSFFERSLLVTYREDSDQSDLPLASGSGTMAHLASRIYRAQLGNETMKSFRWWNETKVGPALGGGAVTRNSLINEPVVTLDDRNPDRVDILHEYFIGFDQFDAFVQACRDVIPASYQEFLNVTLRYVAQDDQSTLAFATIPRIAAVMSFSQELTHRAEADMRRMTEALIDRIVAIGGTYYLPYRPHARVDQMTRAYQRAEEFARFKREIDPSLVLRNQLWENYLRKL